MSDLHADIEEAQKACEESASEDYDGIEGTLPGWVPEPDKQRFRRIRERILINKKVDPAVVRCWLKDINSPVIPEAYTEDVRTLAHLRWAVSLGPEEGVKQLAGEDAVLGLHRRQQLRCFAKSNAEEKHNDREKEWLRWREEANRLIEINSSLAGHNKKSELARKIKENLALSESIETIRKRL